MRVKPAAGLTVRDPISRLAIPDIGKDVPASSYWLRRLKSGDVVLVDQIPDSDSSESQTKDEE